VFTDSNGKPFLAPLDWNPNTGELSYWHQTTQTAGVSSRAGDGPWSNETKTTYKDWIKVSVRFGVGLLFLGSPFDPQNPLEFDIDGSRAKVKNDQYCREALNKLLASTTPNSGFIDNQKFINGKWTSVDIYDALDLLSAVSVVSTGKSGVTREGSMEFINDLSVDIGGRTLYVNSSYATRSREEKIFGLLHESLHMFSGYTDQALALAAQKLDGVKDKDLKVFASDAEGRKKASLRLNEYILKNCKGLSAGIGTTIRF